MNVAHAFAARREQSTTRGQVGRPPPARGCGGTGLLHEPAPRGGHRDRADERAGHHPRSGLERPRRAAGAASRTSRCSTRPAIEARRPPRFPPYERDPAFSERAWRRLSRSDQIAVIASREALVDSGLLDASMPRDRMGVILGSGTADLMRNEEWFADMRRRGIRRAPPSKIFDHFPNTPCDVVASCFGFEGTEVVRAVGLFVGHRGDRLRGRRDRMGPARRGARRRERRAVPADVQRLQRAATGRQGAVPAVLPEPPGHEPRRSRGDARARRPGACAATRRQHLRGSRRVRRALRGVSSDGAGTGREGRGGADRGRASGGADAPRTRWITSTRTARRRRRTIRPRRAECGWRSASGRRACR